MIIQLSYLPNYKHPFSFVIKTYAQDFCYSLLLGLSIIKYAKCDSPIFYIVPNKEIEQFKIKIFDTGDFTNTTRLIYIITEDLLCDIVSLNTETIDTIYNTNVGGWKVQQILKLMFAYTNFSENYLTIDSATIFNKRFHYRDYYFHDNTIMVQASPTQKIHQFEYLTSNNSAGWLHDEVVQLTSSFRYIQNTVNNIGDYTAWYISGTGIYSSEYVKKLDSFLKNQGICGIPSAIVKSPYELYWYGEFCLTHLSPKPNLCHPEFLTHVHNQEELTHSLTNDKPGIILQPPLSLQKQHVLDFIQYHYGLAL